MKTQRFAEPYRGREGSILGPTGMILGAAYGAGGVNEKTTIRETVQGTATGAATGAAVAAGLSVVFPPAEPFAVAAGAISGGIAGGVEGLGQGIFDTNRDYFVARDPGRKLPDWAKPSSDFRVFYQGFLKDAAGTLVGDETTDYIGTGMSEYQPQDPQPQDPQPQDPFKVFKDMGISGAFEGALADIQYDPSLLRPLQGVPKGASEGAVIGFAGGGLLGAQAGAVVGAEAAFGQGLYNANANEAGLAASDRGRNLPSWAQPAYQAGLAAAALYAGYQTGLYPVAAAFVGDYAADSFLSPAEKDTPQLSKLDVERAVAIGAASQLGPDLVSMGSIYLPWKVIGAPPVCGGMYTGAQPRSLWGQYFGSAPPPSQDPPSTYPMPLRDWDLGVAASQASESTVVH